jgi:hypothetical protein
MEENNNIKKMEERRIKRDNIKAVLIVGSIGIISFVMIATFTGIGSVIVDLPKVAYSSVKELFVKEEVYNPSQSNTNAWLIGEWSVYVPEFGTVKLSITDERTLILAGERTTYSIKGNTMYIGDGTPFPLNKSNQTIDFGEGYYFRKIR